MKKLFLLFALVLAMAFPVISADHYNQGVVTVYESHTQITYEWKMTVPTTGDSTGSWHSQPMLIADCNATYGYVYSIGAAGEGTEDANILYHFSMDDRSTWVSSTPADLDAQGGVAKNDSVGIEEKAVVQAYRCGRWMVVEYDGQTSNESNRLYTWVGGFVKDLTINDNAGGWVRIGRFANKSVVDP